MNKKIILVILFVFIVLLAAVGGFSYYALSNPNHQKNNISISEEKNLSTEHISYILNEMGAYQLKSYQGNPKIEIQVDDEIFSSEIIEGNITTKKGGAEDEDIKITTRKDEVFAIIDSENPKDYIKESVSSGRTSITLASSYTKLFARGYLNLYQEITGESFTGSAIKIFS